MSRSDQNRTFEDVDIGFRNFAGKAGKFNNEGDRSFALFLKEEDAESLIKDGWNVKRLKDRDDGSVPQAYLQVKVRFENKPPKVVLVTSRGLTYLTEDIVDTIDYTDIHTADVCITPYDWVVNGNSGRTAYLKTLYVRAEEDYLQFKWEAWVEDQQILKLGPSTNEYAEAGWIDGEVVEEVSA